MEKITLDTITSKNNQIIKDTKRLLTSSKLRRQQNAFVLEGARLCFDVLNSVYKVKTLLFTEAIFNKYPEKVKQLSASYIASFVTDDVAAKLGETSTSGIFAVRNVRFVGHLRDKIMPSIMWDPSNVGAPYAPRRASIDRIAYKCCDIFNSKALRASMGSILRMNVVDIDNLVDTLSSLKEKYSIYSTVPDSTAVNITTLDFSKPSICVIGNEANGVEDDIKNISHSLVTIPMRGRAESLNASVAASLTMWEMLR
ncbi:MAG: TrmH family RNA methyltransferase [Eubacterium sp.]